MSRVLPISSTMLIFVLVFCALGLAQQPPTKTMYITLSTRIDAPMKMMGMPDMPRIPGMPTGEPVRTITGRALYEQPAVEPIFVTVPEDLKLPDNHLVLHLPKPATVTPGEEEPTQTQPTKPMTMEMVNTLYWHPDEAEGPISETFTVETGGAGGPMGMAMPDLSRIVQEVDDRQAEGSETNLPETLGGQGDYVLNTGGTATLDGFLPPLSVLSPDMAQLTPAEGIQVQWEPVAGARGYLVSAMGSSTEDAGGGKMRMTMISWYSTLDEPPVRIRGGYQQATTIADDLRDGVLLPGDTTSCMIPAGIFEDVMMLTIRLEAIGNDFYSNEDGITVFGTIRSEWQGMGMIMGQ